MTFALDASLVRVGLDGTRPGEPYLPTSRAGPLGLRVPDDDVAALRTQLAERP
jgi:hypothetical protein